LFWLPSCNSSLLTVIWHFESHANKLQIW
jgi:hypothetical protein